MAPSLTEGVQKDPGLCYALTNPASVITKNDFPVPPPLSVDNSGAGCYNEFSDLSVLDSDRSLQVFSRKGER